MPLFAEKLKGSEKFLMALYIHFLTRVCVCVLKWGNGYTFAPQELSKSLDICPNINSSLSWVNRTWMLDGLNCVGARGDLIWTASVLSWRKIFESVLKFTEDEDATLPNESSSVRSVAWKSNGNTMKCFNHAHKTTEFFFFFFLYIKHSFTTCYLFKMYGIALKKERSRKIFSHSSDLVSLFDFVTFYRWRMTPGDARVVSAFVKLCKPNKRRQMDVIKWQPVV